MPGWKVVCDTIDGTYPVPPHFSPGGTKGSTMGQKGMMDGFKWLIFGTIYPLCWPMCTLGATPIHRTDAQGVNHGRQLNSVYYLITAPIWHKDTSYRTIVRCSVRSGITTVPPPYTTSMWGRQSAAGQMHLAIMLWPGRVSHWTYPLCARLKIRKW